MHNLFLSISFIVSVKVCIFPLDMHDIVIYVARWWEKYLLKLSPLKHTCSWRDKLIVLIGFLFSIFCILGLLKEFGGGLELTGNLARNILKSMNWTKRKCTMGKVEPLKSFLRKKKFFSKEKFQMLYWIIMSRQLLFLI